MRFINRLVASLKLWGGNVHEKTELPDLIQTFEICFVKSLASIKMPPSCVVPLGFPIKKAFFILFFSKKARQIRSAVTFGKTGSAQIPLGKQFV